MAEANRLTGSEQDIDYETDKGEKLRASAELVGP
jgi:hypothetical protein